MNGRGEIPILPPTILTSVLIFQCHYYSTRSSH